MEPVEYLRGIRRRWRVDRGRRPGVGGGGVVHVGCGARGRRRTSRSSKRPCSLLDARGTQFGTRSGHAGRAASTRSRSSPRSTRWRSGQRERCTGDQDPDVLVRVDRRPPRTPRRGSSRSPPPLRPAHRAERVADAFARSLTDYLEDQRAERSPAPDRGAGATARRACRPETWRGADSIDPLQPLAARSRPSRSSSPLRSACRCWNGRPRERSTATGAHRPTSGRLRLAIGRVPRSPRWDRARARPGTIRSEDHHLEDRRGHAPLPAPRGDPSDPEIARSRGRGPSDLARGRCVPTPGVLDPPRARAGSRRCDRRATDTVRPRATARRDRRSPHARGHERGPLGRQEHDLREPGRRPRRAWVRT